MRQFGYPVGPITLIDDWGLMWVRTSPWVGKMFAARGMQIPCFPETDRKGYKGKKNKKGFTDMMEKEEREDTQ